MPEPQSMPDNRTPVMVVGEALIDIVMAPGHAPVEQVGGSPANVAIGLARLGHRVGLATHLGQDARGQRIAELCGSEGVSLTAGSRSAERTSTALAHIDDAGHADYRFDFAFAVDPDAHPSPGGHVHTGSIAATARGAHADLVTLLVEKRPTQTVSYDPNARPALMGRLNEARAKVELLVSLSDVVKASDEDAAWLYPGVPLSDVLRNWARLGPAVVVATRGGAGALALVGGSLHEVAAEPATVVDTVGAGDSFMSGLLSGLLDAGLLGGADARLRLHAAPWDDIEPAIERARHAAAITVSRQGSNPPTRQDLGSA